MSSEIVVSSGKGEVDAGADEEVSLRVVVSSGGGKVDIGISEVDIGTEIVDGSIVVVKIGGVKGTVDRIVVSVWESSVVVRTGGGIVTVEIIGSTVEIIIFEVVDSDGIEVEVKSKEV